MRAVGSAMGLRVWAAAAALVAAGASLAGAGESVRLAATADVWLSDASEAERNTSAGKAAELKLKSVQEMAAIRFDPAPARGREVVRATLHLRRASDGELRYVRVSTVNQDWEEGSGRHAYGPPDGATYVFADAGSGRPWAWPGSCFADVVMGAGESIAAWAERREAAEGWIEVPLAPELVYAMVAGDTDGLAVMDGGTLALHNNRIHSAQAAGSEPYVEVELGAELASEPPPRPVFRAAPALERAHAGAGAIRITIEPAAAGSAAPGDAPGVFCWRVALDGKRLERWRVRHPRAGGGEPTSFYLEDLEPGRSYELAVTAVSPAGRASEPVTVSVSASAGLAEPAPIGLLEAPAGGSAPPVRIGRMKVWALPGLVKISPERADAMCGELGENVDYRRVNAVWDGARVRLDGARGEYVSFQLCVENLGAGSLAGIEIRPGALAGPGGATIGEGEIELFRNWYAKNRSGAWQPAYCVPIARGTTLRIPDPERNLASQENQTVYFDLYVPKGAPPGDYAGAVTVAAEGAEPIAIPVALRVFDFELPDRLRFWPELNAYEVPRNALEYYRLAHRHRSVLNCWRWAPELAGAGKEIRVVWDRYDRAVGPLLDGTAFRDERRAGAPVECMYLPFEDSWPTPLSPQTYDYRGPWPGKGGDRRQLIEHELKAPYIGDGLSAGYKDAFRAVEAQFIAHFRERGWTRTEMQCFFGGKSTHRIEYGSNMWWTTDEPCHWDDWLALQFFTRLWSAGRRAADRRLWPARADISRPQWLGTTLSGAADTIYLGTGAALDRRAHILAEDQGIDLRAYGGASPDVASNLESVARAMSVWLDGGTAFLPWQTLGGERSFDENDKGASGGAALLVPGKRLGHPVVADMRLKAFRDAQQLTEYLQALADREGLRREQVKLLLAPVFDPAHLRPWHLAELRRKLAARIAAPR